MLTAISKWAQHRVETAPTRPRALHVATRFRRGGSEKRIRDIVGALPELEHTVMLGDDSDLDLARSEIPSAEITSLASLHRSLSPLDDLMTLVRLVGHIRRGDYDIVFSHQSKAGALVRASSLLNRRPAIVHSLSMASFGPGYGKIENTFYQSVERWLGRHTDAYVVVGEDLVRKYSNLGIDESRFHVVRSGAFIPTEPPTRESARAQLGIPADVALLVYIGSLEPRKGVTALPDLVANVGARLGGRDRVCLLIAGTGPEQTALEQAIRERGLQGSMRLLGHVNDVTPLVAGADVMVLLSRVEGLPQVLVQAAACALPFVSYAVDGVDELLARGAVGTSVPVGDLAGAIDATVNLLDQDRDKSHLDTTSWSPDAIANGYRRAIAGLLPDIFTGRLAG